MSQEIEIEFKNLLTQSEFEQLKKAFKISSTAFIKQSNDYYDTDCFQLKQRNSALRIREKSGRHQLTLKQPHSVGLMEFHQSLDHESLQAFRLDKQLPDGDVQKRLAELGISPDQLNHLGRLTTDRAEKHIESGLLVLDHSFYLDHEDYELEFETAQFEEGQTAFNQLLETFDIPKRTTPNKIMRFYSLKKERATRDPKS